MNEDDDEDFTEYEEKSEYEEWSETDYEQRYRDYQSER